MTDIIPTKEDLGGEPKQQVTELVSSSEELINQLKQQVIDLTAQLAVVNAVVETSKKSIWGRISSAIKGYRTMFFAGSLAVIPAILDYWGGVDMKNLFGLSPQTSAYIGLAFVILRAITTGPIPPVTRS